MLNNKKYKNLNQLMKKNEWIGKIPFELLETINWETIVERKDDYCFVDVAYWVKRFVKYLKKNYLYFVEDLQVGFGVYISEEFETCEDNKLKPYPFNCVTGFEQSEAHDTWYHYEPIGDYPKILSMIIYLLEINDYDKDRKNCVISKSEFNAIKDFIKLEE